MDAHCNYQWLSSACYIAFGIIHITTLTCFAFTILGAFAKLRKVSISIVKSVCLSAWNKLALTGQICTQFISILKNLSKIQV